MNKKDDSIRKEVSEFYDKIGRGEVKTDVSPEALAESLGYKKEDLEQLPEGVNLGLSCGNPLENLLLRDGETLLDLGSGTGMDVFLTRIKFPNAGTLYGLDRSEVMVQKAQSAAERKGFQGIEFRIGELREMPFEDESIDVCISNCVINLEPQKEKVYREIARVLKDGGKCILSDIVLKKPLPDELKDAPNLYGTWVGGALPLEALQEILANIPELDVDIFLDDVTDEYALKWGYGLEIKQYIGKGLFIGHKTKRR